MNQRPKSIVVSLIILGLVVNACQTQQPATPPSSTSTVTSTTVPVKNQAAVVPSPTVETHPITASTPLMSGPGNTGYEILEVLPKGENLILMGQFNDFVYASATSGQLGYVPKISLEHLPDYLPEIAVQEIPWKSVKFMENFIDMNSVIQDSTSVLIKNPLDGYYDFVGSPYTFTTPFQITARLTPSLGADGAIKLADQPNVGGVEWWKGIRRINLTSANGKLSLRIMDGRAENSVGFIGLSLPVNNPVTLRFEDPQGKILTILDQDGNILQSILLTEFPNIELPNGLFPESQVYIGSVTGPKSTLQIDHLNLQIPPDGKLIIAPAPELGLKDLAGPYGITIGSVLDWSHLRNPQYQQVFIANFNLAAISEFSWDGFWLGRGQYDWGLLDQEVNWCIQHGLRIRAASLVYGATDAPIIPAWLREGQFSKDEYEQILKELIQAVVGRYKGKVTEWIIANESTSRAFYPGTDFWMDHIGPDYIEKSFRWTREVDPDGILILNEGNNESRRDFETQRVTDALYEKVKDLISKGVPVDVVGMQMHLLLKFGSPVPPQKDDVVATMKQFADLGVKIMITELDVDLHGQPGSLEEKYAFQASLFADMMSACIESGACVSYTTWGVSDATSWITADCDTCAIREVDGDPLLFDRNFQPKPAYFAVSGLLQRAEIPK